MRLSVVIPVYGCREALPELYRRLSNTLIKITDDYEIVLVNDNCPQNSWEEIENLCKKDGKVKGIELSRNFGQMKAILAGLEFASGEWIVVMDCDLQDRPEEIIRLWNKAQEGYDIVFGRRKDRKDKKTKVLLANLFYGIYRFATDGNYDGALCNFSIVNRKVIDSYCQMREEHRAYVMYLKWLGFKQTAIDVEHDARYAGKSGYTLKKRIDLALELLTSQSDKVLKLFIKLGMFMSAVAFISIIILVIYHQVAQVSVGWTSLIATTVLIGGIEIMVIGVLGLYVGNIFVQVKKRPLYVIRQVINGEKE
ncbi:glycosyltransferase family 2 protein [Butyrivibrio sp. VCB2006]|uniref:glycosyltransferase family 2 protein n=1 Tax=Butyrivibrio sp. VCB2006 TaxID=1280679 RepID=UPI0004234FBA|nr:glycosyltransferase family 2 protein [Butyrivibrio sp. VCB2006]